ncbi:hypothetical protein RhiJN_20377 [Ceratobasidium sp. AG-Ba]|nr:hypothetical protein RhiJN_20377 [Ceratobasidium sp. AG-Ba]
MGWLDDQQYNDYQASEPHEASLTHELIAGAASYEAAKAYQNHLDQNGDPQSHEQAKDMLAAVSGAFIDREVETRGLDFIDAEKAKRQARDQVWQQYDDTYNNN